MLQQCMYSSHSTSRSTSSCSSSYTTSLGSSSVVRNAACTFTRKRQHLGVLLPHPQQQRLRCAAGLQPQLCCRQQQQQQRQQQQLQRQQQQCWLHAEPLRNTVSRACSNSISSRPCRLRVAAAAAGPSGGSSSSSSAGMPLPPGVTPANLQNLHNINPADIDPNGLAGLFMAYAMQLQQAADAQQAADQAGGGRPGANVLAKNLSFHPPGAAKPLLDDVSFNLKPNQLGLIIGRSGSGKTTLLQLLAGLSEQTSGQIFIHRPSAADHASGLFVPAHIEQRMQQVGLVFQFPERHFLGDDVMAEMTFTWPRDVAYWGERQAMAVRMQRVVDAVGLSGIPFNISPSALSGGQQRRLALALQLVRGPSVLLLDEPLAGLDWHARREVVALLLELKREATLLVVSHDLADIAPLVDCAWRMELGGRLEAVQWPPDSLSDVED